MSTPLVLQIVASSVSIANKTGEIIRNIIKSGDLGIVDKATGQKVSISALHDMHTCIHRLNTAITSMMTMQISGKAQNLIFACHNPFQFHPRKCLVRSVSRRNSDVNQLCCCGQGF